ncbi:hypothetical protein pb186bvf_011127 [Paramecium bursaria]
MDSEFLRRHDCIIGEKIGEGSFGQVHKATWHNQTVAIKQVDNQESWEIDIMKMMDHPNIVKYIYEITNLNHIYLIMEFIDGVTLKDIRPKNELEVAQILKQILNALKYMHSLGVVHRDLKPTNILINNKNQVKIIDFGLSYYSKNCKSLYDKCGTLFYMAPEQILSQSYSKQVDIWSTGIILYTLLVGYHPYKHYSKEEFLYNIGQLEFEIPSYISQDAQNLLRRMITIDRQHRYNVDQVLAHPFITRNSLDPIPMSIKEYIHIYNKRHHIMNLIKALMIFQVVKQKSPLKETFTKIDECLIKVRHIRYKSMKDQFINPSHEPSPVRKKKLPQLRQRVQSNLYEKSNKSIDIRLPMIKKYF